ncbi:MAG TPA: alcohol dehydrogenase catalytic domain-containing protein [Candidatus Acidoferrum sp.]|jgi:glutathione-independent formaldehyde dehydrogenase|nr:alcohol dehydrogenase catalytic domain-containing protein [Candidatus Acidoferrum sp.]
MMQAVVLNGARHITIEAIEEPALRAPTDVLLRLTSTAICGTDLHMYEGRLGGGQRLVIGHEPLGVVEKVGDAVVNVRVGDRVTVPTHICCGFCANCVHGYSAQCLTNNPGKAGAAYGYPGMGGYTGAQTELLRVPFGDANCLKLPGEPGDRFEHDFVLLADALPTAFHATQMVDVRTSDIVVIYGAGAIGLLTAMCAFVCGAAQVFVVDAIPARLEKAGELGAIPVDMSQGNAADRILEQIARERPGIAWRGEEANLGATVCVDAIGFQARDPRDYAIEHPTAVIDDLARIVAPKGRLSIIGVFLDSDPLAHGKEAQRGEYVIPWGTLFKKGVTIGMGRDDDENYNDHLRDMIVAGRMKPSQIVSHRLPLRDAADAFAKFDARSDGYIKVVLEP